MTMPVRSSVFLRDDLRSGLLAIIVTQRAMAHQCGGALPGYDAGFTAAIAAVVALVGLEGDVLIGRALGSERGAIRG